MKMWTKWELRFNTLVSVLGWLPSDFVGQLKGEINNAKKRRNQVYTTQ